MLRRDTSAIFDKSGVWIFSRYRFATTNFLHNRTLSRGAYDRLLVLQQESPVRVAEDAARRRVCWLFRGEFYWDDDGYDAPQIKALVLQRLQQKERRVQRAVALMQQSEPPRTQQRGVIPNELRVYVWNRDGGRCVECESDRDLQYDHIIPVAFGGATNADNLQLLCESCNRAKGASIV